MNYYMKLENKLKYLKMWLIIILVIVFFVHPTFAENITSCAKDDWQLWKITNGLVFFWKIVSWIWIFLWNIAGVLMTNNMVYWEFMWFDVSLWKIWQISRSFCNYALAVIFLYNILKYILNPDWDTKSVKTILTQILWASVLIQASWFIMMALVDLSTIWLATVSSFPSQVISSSESIKNNMITSLKKNEVLKHYNTSKIVTLNAFSDDYLNSDSESFIDTSVDREGWPITTEAMIDNLVPRANNLWGPLVFLWFSALETQNFITPEYQATTCPDLFVKNMIYLITEVWASALYSFALLILIVILIVRLFYLWIFIALSPVVILLYMVKWIDVWKDMTDFFAVKNVLYLIFQPVIFWMYISLMFVIMIVSQWFFNKGSLQLANWGVGIIERTSDSEVSIWNTIKIQTIKAKKSIWDLFVSLVVLVFMRLLVKFALQNSVGSVKVPWFAFVGNTLKSAKSMALNTWVIPTPQWKIWFAQLKQLPDRWIEEKSGIWRERTDIAKNKISDFFGVSRSVKGITEKQLRELNEFVQREKDIEGTKLQSRLSSLKGVNGWIQFLDIRDIFAKYVNSQYNSENKLFGKTEWARIKNSFNGYNEEKIETVKKAYDDILNDPNTRNTFYVKLLWWSELHVPTTYEQLIKPEYWIIRVK